MRGLEAFAFSSAMAGAIAGGLALVASRAMDAPEAWRWATLASSGSFVIYSLDRLRDVDRDRMTSPRRTAFVLRWRRALVVGIVAATLAFALAAARAPTPVLALCLGIGSLGALHRRLKGSAGWKTAYVSLAWIGVCVGMPWLGSGRPAVGLWVAGILGPILAANLIASNLRDDESQLLRARPGGALGVARALGLLALGLTALGPAATQPLAWIALAELAALGPFRADERYGHVVVDGALLLGCGLALAQELLTS